MKTTGFSEFRLFAILTVFMLSVVQSPSWALPDCHDVNPRTVSAGFKCSIENWWVFERVDRAGFGEAWKAPDGVIWSNRIGTGSQGAGMDICAKLGAALPSKQDFQKCADSGCRVVLPGFNGEYYWSNSAFSWEGDNAEAYNGTGGVTVACRLNPSFAIRCVAR